MNRQRNDARAGAGEAAQIPKQVLTRGTGGTDKGTRPQLAGPHDRDESVDAADAHGIEPAIEQAAKDVEKGLEDTDLRGTAAEKFDRRFGPRRRHGTP